ncbi:MAG TPA: surface-adhesin E family protein [Nitrospira sp.]|nr:surface-adhesin E family protein [Nitrospira sp.]
MNAENQDARIRFSVWLPCLFRISATLSLIALLGVGQVRAEWVDIGGKVQDGLTIYRVYIDPDHIHHNGDIVTLWALFDYKSIQSIVGGPWLSSKAQRQFDCAEHRIRLLGYMTFTGNMGSGEPVFSNSQESEWEPIASDSIDSKLWDVACSKK